MVGLGYDTAEPEDRNAFAADENAPAAMLGARAVAPEALVARGRGRAREHLGREAQVPADEGLARTHAYFVEALKARASGG